MGRDRVTPEVFNETAWNLGLPVRWSDTDRDGAIDRKELAMVAAASTFAMQGKALNAVVRIIKEGASGNHLKVVRTPAYIAELDRRVAAGKSRETLRDRDMAYRGWVEHTIDFRGLTPAEQKAAWILVHEVLPAVEAVHLAELDPKNPRHLQEIAATGHFADYLHAYYSGGPWCQDVTDRACGSHRALPPRVPNAGLWPERYTDADVSAVQEKDLQSPFVERYLEGGTLRWRSLNAAPRLRAPLARVSAGLRKAAAVAGIDPTLQKFLTVRAAEFANTTQAYPFFDGDVAWIAIKGGLDVTLGFYETDDAALGSTAIMEAFVGPVDARSEVLGRRFQVLAPLMEEAIARDLGPQYPRNDFSKGLAPLRFEQAISAGDSRVKYVTGGFRLPNIAPHGDASLYKKVFLSNHLAARLEGVMGPMATLVMDPAQRAVGREDWDHFAVAHENAHGVGPKGLSKIGQPYGGGLEEARADQEGIASLPIAVAQWTLTQAEADRACLAMAFTLLRGLSYGMNDTHGVGAFIEFSELVKAGGLVETPEGYFRVNFTDGAVYRASTAIGRRIAALQLRSATDPEGATKAAEAWLAEAKAALPKRMKEEFLPKLVQMPKDVFPWYHFQFADAVVAEMSK